MTYARIAGVGSCLPDKVVSNKDLEKVMDTSDEWIRERTGIKRRHVAVDGETTGTMSLIAAQRAMDMAGVSADELDLIIVGTCTPDKVIPATACIVQRELGVKGCAAVDLNAACSGFISLGIIAESRRGSSYNHMKIGIIFRHMGDRRRPRRRPMIHFQDRSQVGSRSAVTSSTKKCPWRTQNASHLETNRLSRHLLTRPGAPMR